MYTGSLGPFDPLTAEQAHGRVKVNHKGAPFHSISICANGPVVQMLNVSNPTEWGRAVDRWYETTMDIGGFWGEMR